MRDFSGVVGDARKRLEEQESKLWNIPFDIRPECSCGRRDAHVHVTNVSRKMAEYPGYDPT